MHLEIIDKSTTNHGHSKSIYRVRGICVTNFLNYKTGTYNQGRAMKINGHVNLGLKHVAKKFALCLMAFRWWDRTFFSKLA